MKQVQEHSSDSVKVILIGNKSDLTEERKITFQEGKDMAVKYDVPFFEVSAKMN
jgi:GTPase SAR1 family protein